jgi:hypothetical protein
MAHDNDLHEIKPMISPDGGIIVDPTSNVGTGGHPPPFRAPPRLMAKHNVNPFLVILNAEIKFRRYKDLEIPEEERLPPRIRSLMEKTSKLVRLIYSAAEKYPPLQGPLKEMASGSKRKRGSSPN